MSQSFGGCDEGWHHRNDLPFLSHVAVITRRNRHAYACMRIRHLTAPSRARPPTGANLTAGDSLHPAPSCPHRTAAANATESGAGANATSADGAAADGDKASAEAEAGAAKDEKVEKDKEEGSSDDEEGEGKTEDGSEEGGKEEGAKEEGGKEEGDKGDNIFTDEVRGKGEARGRGCGGARGQRWVNGGRKRARAKMAATWLALEKPRDNY